MNKSLQSSVTPAESNTGFRLRLRWRSRTIKSAGMACILVALANSATVRAELQVRGDANAIRIEANQSKVSEILSVLQRDYHVRYRTSIALDAPISGTYSGSLRPILARVLNGYDYVIQDDGSTIEVVVIGKKGDRAVVLPETTNTLPAKSLTAHWRALIDEFTRSQKSNSGRATTQ